MAFADSFQNLPIRTQQLAFQLGLGLASSLAAGVQAVPKSHVGRQVTSLHQQVLPNVQVQFALVVGWQPFRGQKRAVASVWVPVWRKSEQSL